MKKSMFKRILTSVLALVMLFAFCACGSETNDSGNEAAAELTIAYQGGIGYAPIHIMETKKLIESNYDGKVEITFQKLDSGADINTGIIGGTIDIGCMGVGPAVSAVASGVPAKIISNLCSQTHGLMTSDPSIKTLSDIKDTQIALVNIGSFQHILLAMAAEKELGDAHALDNNIVKMAHAEGYAALDSGTYKLHLTSSPFINRERESDKFTEIKAVNEIWPDGNSFLVSIASTKLESENPELFEAVTKAFSQAISFINENENEAAEIIATYLQQDVETTLKDLQDPTCMFFGELKGVSQMADFMYRAKFIENEVKFDELKFSNVTGD
ncbi:MAG: ABC transporter substrate-binding protein [Clostridia bacterium]|nr:ABC transporter substrate-binding protein [Clostridia bacterium]